MATATSRKQKKDRSKIWIGVLKFCLLVVGAAVCFINVLPYQRSAEILFYGEGSNPIVRLLKLLPLIGWVINSFQWFVSSLIGICAWGVLQLLELLPILLFGSRDSLTALIRSIETSRQLPLKDTDAPIVRKLKLKHNKRLFGWLTTARVIATVAYILDFLFVSISYPAIEGGIQNLGLFIAAPTWGDIDLKNLAISLVSLFAVEVVVWLWQWLDDYADMRKGGKRTNES